MMDCRNDWNVIWMTEVNLTFKIIFLSNQLRRQWCTTIIGGNGNTPRVPDDLSAESIGGNLCPTSVLMFPVDQRWSIKSASRNMKITNLLVFWWNTKEDVIFLLFFFNGHRDTYPQPRGCEDEHPPTVLWVLVNRSLNYYITIDTTWTVIKQSLI